MRQSGMTRAMHDILIRGGILFDGAGNRRRRRRSRHRGRPHRRDRAAHHRRRAKNHRRRKGSPSRRVSSTSRPTRISRCRSIRRPKARCARASPPRSSAIAAFRSRRRCPARSSCCKDYLSPSAPWLPFRETSFPDYLDTFPPTAVNAGMLVGHNTLRLMVMGMAERAPSAAELDADDRAARRRARCRRARHVVGPVHAARLLRASRTR